MKAKFNRKKNGYTPEKAYEYVDTKKPILSLSTELDIQNVFKDKKPTDEIDCYKAWFVQEGLEPFSVKFKKEIDLPKFLSVIEFTDLQACEIKFNVYFKAEDISEVK